MQRIDVAFLQVRTSHAQLNPMLAVINSIEAHAVVPSTCYHVVADQDEKPLQATLLRLTRLGRGRVRAHSLITAPSFVKSLHSELCQLALGPGCVYLWKPLLHLVLPRWVVRAIVLDADVHFFADISTLWRQFDHFHAAHLIGLAEEQKPA